MEWLSHPAGGSCAPAQPGEGEAKWVEWELELRGVLQGVGMRPHMARLARRARLGGSILNTSAGVRLILRGEEGAVAKFVAGLPTSLPQQAKLGHAAVVAVRFPVERGRAFVIESSQEGEVRRASIPPDSIMCDACRRDVFDPQSRFYGYAFTTCTDCGPRYTVTEGFPYDREKTSLRAFPMCSACAEAYADPNDRRYHAETIACAVCGPRVWVEDARGQVVGGSAFHTIRRVLAEGGIAAVRGVGGFALVVDACNADAVARLRRLKQRPHKPLATMARDVKVLEALRIPPEAVAAMGESTGSIVITEPDEDAACRMGVALDGLAPYTRSLGIMLPTSPLHALLFEAPTGKEMLTAAAGAGPQAGGDPLTAGAIPKGGGAPAHGFSPSFSLLVVSSGNAKGDPIARTCEEARRALKGIADVFLMHDREIQRRVDDSVQCVRRGKPQVWRRARGFTPALFPVASPIQHPVLAAGVDLKNAVAIADATTQSVLLSQHLGDVDTATACANAQQTAEDLLGFIACTPQAVAADLHPDMATGRLAEHWAARFGVPLIVVQHHHAHARAAMVEHGLTEAYALVFDGVGYGVDATAWGAELLRVWSGTVARGPGFERLGTFLPAPMVGGDRATVDMARQWLGRVWQAGIDPLGHCLPEHLCITEQERAVWTQQCAAGINAPGSHAAGRLFDAVAAWLGIVPRQLSFEGQAAIWLEACAKRHRPVAGERPPWGDASPFLMSRHRSAGGSETGAAAAPAHCNAANTSGRAEGGRHIDGVDWSNLFRYLVDVGAPPADPAAKAHIAYWFHRIVADAAITMLRVGAARGCARPFRDVVLTGGVMMNGILVDMLRADLEQAGYRVHLPRLAPPNDGGVALGQAVIAAEEMLHRA